ncbi:MAG: hypothetical protein H6756_08960 [Candidatus Omnitrophica bacterium]|nr:hypothetical protein [Candidatus Omnitrophota bacterium]
MKKLIVMTVLLAVGTAGCETMNTGTGKGAAIGAATGAVIGGIVGHQDDEHGVEGAAIGAAAGAVAGGLIGKATEGKGGAKQLTVTEVAEMSQKGVPGNIIIDEMRRTKSKYNLSVDQIDYLRENGVEGRVVDYMLGTM